MPTININYKISTIFQKKGISSLVQVGSSLVERNAKDIDYILIGNQEKKEIINYLNTILESALVSELDDSFRFELDGKIINIAVFNENDFDYRIHRIMTCELYGELREWVIGYWLPEAFMKDVIDGYIVFDNGYFKNKQQELIENQESIIFALTKRVKLEIECCIGELNTGVIPSIITYSKLLLSLLRFYNLKNKTIEKNFSKIVLKIKKDKKLSFILDVMNRSEKDIRQFVICCEGRLDDKTSDWNMENAG